MLREIVERDVAYDRARRSYFERSATVIDRGGRRWTCEELHER
ncbi:MAG: hypothetical protein ACRDH9_13755 [Actinomycetota bacterium]